jgi:putative nucleotidyltransferase with HDIG domain
MRDLAPEIDRISEIVSFPRVLAEIQTELLKDSVASVRIAQLVETDAALTVQVLRAANSPFYGLRWEVTSVPQAVAVLGFEEVSHLALLFHMRQQIFKLNEHQSDFLDMLWKHSLSTAIVAQSLASKFGQKPYSKAFTAGILHDLGKIVLVQYYPIYLDEIRQLSSESGVPDIDAEEQMVGITHANIGARLCQKWMLPAELSDIVQHHHHPASAKHSPLLTAAVRFADLQSEIWLRGIGEQPLTFRLEDDPCWKILKEEASYFHDTPIEQLSLDLEKDLSRRLDLFDIG